MLNQGKTRYIDDDTPKPPDTSVDVLWSAQAKRYRRLLTEEQGQKIESKANWLVTFYDNIFITPGITTPFTKSILEAYAFISYE